MNELKPKIYDEAASLDYVLTGGYYVPVIELPEDNDRPIGKWGRIHSVYLEETNPLLLNHLLLTDKLQTSTSGHRAALGVSFTRWRRMRAWPRI